MFRIHFCAGVLLLLSCKGTDGLTGPAGPQGPAGPEGPQGPPGTVDYSVAIANGTAAQGASFNVSGTGTIGSDLTVGGTISGNGAGIANLSASQISSGTLADARLSANVPLLSSNNSFSGSQTFGGNAFVSGTLTGGKVVSTSVQSAASAPSACDGAHAGDLYFNSAGNGLFYCDGSAWQPIERGTAVPIVDVRGIVTKTYADGLCPSPSLASYVPRSWAGQTGDAICASDSRGTKTCTAVKFVFVTSAGAFGPYTPFDRSCSAAIGNPWPWGADPALPDTFDAEWGRGDTFVVCCQ